MLPTPLASDYKHGNCESDWRRKTQGMGTIVHSSDWHKYAPAIERWEKILGRPAPAPTKNDAKDGAPRLNPEFSEFMLGLPKGWVTGVGLSRLEQLKAIGNGVCPQQAKAALSILLDGVEW